MPLTVGWWDKLRFLPFNIMEFNAHGWVARILPLFDVAPGDDLAGHAIRWPAIDSLHIGCGGRWFKYWLLAA